MDTYSAHQGSKPFVRTVPPMKRSRWVPWLIGGVLFFPLLLVALIVAIDDDKSWKAAVREYREGIDPHWYTEGFASREKYEKWLQSEPSFARATLTLVAFVVAVVAVIAFLSAVWWL